MSFEDHIRKHKKELELKELNPEIWSSIEGQMATPKQTNNYTNFSFQCAEREYCMKVTAYLSKFLIILEKYFFKKE